MPDIYIKFCTDSAEKDGATTDIDNRNKFVDVIDVREKSDRLETGKYNSYIRKVIYVASTPSTTI